MYKILIYIHCMWIVVWYFHRNLCKVFRYINRFCESYVLIFRITVNFILNMIKWLVKWLIFNLLFLKKVSWHPQFYISYEYYKLIYYILRREKKLERNYLLACLILSAKVYKLLFNDFISDLLGFSTTINLIVTISSN